jgi:hypothetical protein
MRWLSRDRSGVTRDVAPRVPPRPVAAAPPEPDMPPRPQLRIPERPLPPATGGVPFDTRGHPLRAEFDPCGAPPVAANRKRRP